MKAKNRILLQRIGYTVAGLAAISVAGGWRAGLAAFGATLILRRMLMTLGAHLAGFALAHFRPEQVQLQPEDLPPGRPVVRERVERPGKVERPPAKPRGEPSGVPAPGAAKNGEGWSVVQLRLAHCPQCGYGHRELEVREWHRAAPLPFFGTMAEGVTHMGDCPKTGGGIFLKYLLKTPLAAFHRREGWQILSWRPHDPEGPPGPGRAAGEGAGAVRGADLRERGDRPKPATHEEFTAATGLPVVDNASHLAECEACRAAADAIASDAIASVGDPDFPLDGPPKA